MPRRPAVTEVFNEIGGIQKEPISADELQKAKDSLANSLPGAFETSASAVNSFSNVFTYDLGLDYYTRYAQQVNAVTAEQALNVALRYLQPDRLVVVAVGDRKAIEPSLPSSTWVRSRFATRKEGRCDSSDFQLPTSSLSDQSPTAPGAGTGLLLGVGSWYNLRLQ